MKLLFRRKQKELENVYSFWFRAEEKVSWQAGQSIRLELPMDGERRFSISSAPFEEDICVTTRISDSDFKQALNELRPGEIINGYNIEGDFTWQKTDQPKVLAASGIGITPYRAILKQLDFEKKPIEATLFYAARSDKFLFERELKDLQEKHAKFNIIFLPKQRISAQIISEDVPDFQQNLIYLSGPSSMVNEIGTDLLQAGLPEKSLKKDQFTGRGGWDILS